MLVQSRFGPAVWDAASSVDHRSFVEMVNEMRERKAMDVDDVTMLRVVFPADSATWSEP